MKTSSIAAIAVAISSLFANAANATADKDEGHYTACTRDGKSASIDLTIGGKPKGGIEAARSAVQKMWQAIVSPLTAEEVVSLKGYGSFVDHVYKTEDEIDANIYRTTEGNPLPIIGQACM